MAGEFEISLDDFKARLDSGKVKFILDLRLEDEFDSWRIEGRHDFEIVNIPQLDFVGEEEKYLDRLPRDKEIFVVCAHGGASKYSAEVLADNGFKARGLDGGMDAWSVIYDTTALDVTNPAIYQIYRLAKGCITHIIISGKEAVVIDAVRHLEHIKAVIDKHGAKIKYVFDTHLQADHVSGGRELARQAGCEYGIHPLDGVGATYDFLPLEDGLGCRFGGSSMRALHTPGHTPGSTSFLLDERYLFGGDTVMESTVGRPDLGGMVDVWGGLLYNTIHHKLGSLDDAVLVCPTHAASVRERDDKGVVGLTLGKARSILPLFKMIDRDEFMAQIRANLMENPDRYQEIRKANLGIIAPDEKTIGELEIGKNLCGMADDKC